MVDYLLKLLTAHLYLPLHSSCAYVRTYICLPVSVFYFCFTSGCFATFSHCCCHFFCWWKWCRHLLYITFYCFVPVFGANRCTHILSVSHCLASLAGRINFLPVFIRSFVFWCLVFYRGLRRGLLLLIPWLCYFLDTLHNTVHSLTGGGQAVQVLAGNESDRREFRKKRITSRAGCKWIAHPHRQTKAECKRIPLKVE